MGLCQWTSLQAFAKVVHTVCLIHKALVSVNREHNVVICLYVTVALFNLSLHLSYTADRPESLAVIAGLGLCYTCWNHKPEVVSV